MENNDYIEVLAILPYIELSKQVEKEAEAYPHLKVTCRVGNLDQGVQAAKEELKNKSYDMILSRGGTAELLRSNIRGICIQELSISFEDVFYALMLAGSYGEKSAVVSYPALARQAETFKELMDQKIEIHVIRSVEEVRDTLTRLQQEGCTMVVGDVITAQVAKEMGINVILMMSGQNSIREALYFAENLIPLKQTSRRPRLQARQKEEYKTGSIVLFNQEPDEGYFYQSSYGVANSVGETRDAITACSRTSLPVLIMGEPGTGKEAAAMAVYHKSEYHNNPCCRIDCGTVTDREWTRFFNNSSSPLLEVHSTIYFKNIHMLSSSNMRRLQKLIEESGLCIRNKVIFSAVTDPSGQVPRFARYILDEVACMLLHPLPIRERKEDLKNILVIYVNEMNIELGRQIIGFEKEALEEFLSYSWPGNITQVKRVLRQIMGSTEGALITKDTVKKFIRNEVFENMDDLSFNIDLNQTLSDINYDVIRLIMKQENMNQSRTAERLGVGRTTIWRILKQHEGESC